jgi:hypothetical protein
MARSSIQPTTDPVLTGSELLTIGRDEDPTGGPTYSTAQLAITRWSDGRLSFTDVAGKTVYLDYKDEVEKLFLAMAALT